MDKLKSFFSILLLLIPTLSVAQSVEFSHPSGCYSDCFFLEITPTSPLPPDYSIHYSTNGFDPTVSHPLYTSPLFLDDKLYSSFPLFSVQNTPDDLWNPPSDVEHILVVKAAVFDASGTRVSNITTASYAIDTLLGRSIQIPIVSICVDSAALLSEDEGIFIPGSHFDPSAPHWTGNYYQSGSSWERLAHIDFMAEGRLSFSQYCGIRTHGGNSRRLSQKGFSIYAREEYGAKNFKYSFFDSYAFSKFKRLCLKPMCSSWSNAGIQEWLCQMMALDFSFDHLAVQPVVLFINGEYWGIYWLEEKPDEHFVDNHYGFDNDAVDLIGNWFGLEENGSNQDFHSMMDYLQDADLSDQDAFNAFIPTISLESFIEYQLFEMFVGNSDWPANNMRCWHSREHPWQWIFYDGDACMMKTDALSNAFSEALADEWPSNAQSTLLFRRLCENETCVALVISKMEQLLTQLRYKRVGAMIDSAQLYLEEEIVHQITRFQYPSSVQDWEAAIRDIRTYFQNIPPSLRAEVCKRLEVKDNSLSDIRIFPNPMRKNASIRFHSQHAGFTILKVFDLHGNQLFENLIPIVSGSNEVSLSIPLPDGLYIAQIGETSIKFAVIH